MTHVSDDLDFSEFTEPAYERLLTEAKKRFRFEPLGTDFAGSHVLWRHDVDLSVHRAARIAAIEAAGGVSATYLFGFHSPFYNLLERPVADLARRIVHEYGHRLGLHFDSAFYGRLESEQDLEGRLKHEASLLSELVEARVEAFSFHNPQTVNDDFAFDADEIAGLVNASGSTLRERYTYVSDSNGFWRFCHLRDVLADADEERLHVLTHPEWWQAEGMPPRERVVRCIEGRATRTLREYDELLAYYGRLNVG
jgi:hypothetical protein